MSKMIVAALVLVSVLFGASASMAGSLEQVKAGLQNTLSGHSSPAPVGKYYCLNADGTTCPLPSDEDQTYGGGLTGGVSSLDGAVAQVKTPEPSGLGALTDPLTDGELSGLCPLGVFSGGLADCDTATAGLLTGMTDQMISRMTFDMVTTLVAREMDKATCPFGPALVDDPECLSLAYRQAKVQMEISDSMTITDDLAGYADNMAKYKHMLSMVQLYATKPNADQMAVEDLNAMLGKVLANIKEQREYIHTPYNKRTAG